MVQSSVQLYREDEYKERECLVLSLPLYLDQLTLHSPIEANTCALEYKKISLLDFIGKLEYTTVTFVTSNSSVQAVWKV